MFRPRLHVLPHLCPFFRIVARVGVSIVVLAAVAFEHQLGQSVLGLILHQFLMSQLLDVVALLPLKLYLLACDNLHLVLAHHLSGDLDPVSLFRLVVRRQ